MSLANLFDEAAKFSEEGIKPSSNFDALKSIPTITNVYAPTTQQLMPETKDTGWNPFEGAGEAASGITSTLAGAWDWGKQAGHSIMDWGEGLLTNKIEDRGIKDVDKYDKYMEDIKLSRNPDTTQQIWKKMYDEGVIAEDFATRAENQPKKDDSLSIDAKAAEDAKIAFRKELEESVKDIYSEGDRMKMKWLNAGIEEYVAQYADAYNNISMSYDNSAFDKKGWFTKLDTEFKEGLKKTFKGFAENIQAGDDDTKALDKVVATDTDTVEKISQFGEDLFWESNNASREKYLGDVAQLNLKGLWSGIQYLGTYLSGGAALIGESLEYGKQKIFGRYDVSEELRNLDVYSDSASTFERYMGKLGYWAGEVADGTPTLLSMIPTIVIGDKGLSKIPAIAKLASKGKTVNFMWDMVKDTMIYDHIAQTAMGRGNNEQDALENALFNLPINFGINLLHSPVKDSDDIFNKFFGDSSKTTPFADDGFISKDGLDALKEGKLELAHTIEASNKAKGIKGEIDISTLDEGYQKQVKEFQSSIDDSKTRKVNGEATIDDELKWERTKKAINSKSIDISKEAKIIDDIKGVIGDLKKDAEISEDSILQGKKDYLTVSEALKKAAITPEELSSALADAYKNISYNIAREGGGINQNKIANLNSAKDILQQYYLGVEPKTMTIPTTGTIMKYINKLNNEIVNKHIALKELPIGTRISEFVAKGNNNFFNILTGKMTDKAGMMKVLNKRLPKSAPETMLSQARQILKDSYDEDARVFTSFFKTLGLQEIAGLYPNLSSLTVRLGNILQKYDPRTALTDFKLLVETGMQSMSDKQFALIQSMLLSDNIKKISKGGTISEDKILKSDIWNLWKRGTDGVYRLDAGIMNKEKLDKKIRNTMSGGNSKEVVDELDKVGGVKRISEETIKSGASKVIYSAIEKSKSKTLKKIIANNIYLNGENLLNVLMSTNDTYKKMLSKTDKQLMDEFGKTKSQIIAHWEQDIKGRIWQERDKVLLSSKSVDLNRIAKEAEAIYEIEQVLRDEAFGKHLDTIPESIVGEYATEIVGTRLKKNTGGFVVGGEEKVSIKDMKDIISIEDTIESKLQAVDTISKYVYGINDKGFINALQDIISLTPEEGIIKLSKDKLFDLIDKSVSKLNGIQSGSIKIGTNTPEKAKQDLNGMISSFIEEVNAIKNSDIELDSKFQQILMTKYNYSKQFHGIILSNKKILTNQANEMLNLLQASRDIDFIKSESKGLKEFIQESNYRAIDITSEELKNLRYPPFDKLSGKKTTRVGMKDIEYIETAGRKIGEKTFKFDGRANKLPTMIPVSQLKDAHLFNEESKVVFILGERLGEDIIKEGNGIVEATIKDKRISTTSLDAFLNGKIDNNTIYILGQDHFKTITNNVNGVVSVVSRGDVDDIAEKFLNNKNLYVTDIDILPYTKDKVAMHTTDEQKAKTIFKNILFSEGYEAIASKKGMEGFSDKGYILKQTEKGKPYKEWDVQKGFSSFSVEGMEHGKNAAFLNMSLLGDPLMKRLDAEIETVFKRFGYTGDEVISIGSALKILGTNFGELGEVFRKALRAGYKESILDSKFIALNELLSHESIPAEWGEYLSQFKGDKGIISGGQSAEEIFMSAYMGDNLSLKGNLDGSLEETYKTMLLNGSDINDIRSGIYGIIQSTDDYNFFDAIKGMNQYIAMNLFPGLDMFRIQNIYKKFLGIINPKEIANSEKVFNNILVEFLKNNAKLKPGKDIYVIKFLEELQKRGIISQTADIYKGVETLGNLKISLGANLEKISSGDFMRIYGEAGEEETVNILEGIKSTIKNIVSEIEGKTLSEDTLMSMGQKSGISRDLIEGAEDVLYINKETGEAGVKEGFQIEGLETGYESLIDDFVGNINRYTNDLESMIKIKGEYPSIKPDSKVIFSDPINYKLIGASLENESWKKLIYSKTPLSKQGTERWLSDIKYQLNTSDKANISFDILDKLQIANLSKTYGTDGIKASIDLLKNYKLDFHFGLKNVKPNSKQSIEYTISNMYTSVIDYLNRLKQSGGRQIKGEDKLFSMSLGDIVKDYYPKNINVNPLWKTYTGEFGNVQFYRKIELLNDRYAQDLREMFKHLDESDKLLLKTTKSIPEYGMGSVKLKEYIQKSWLHKKTNQILDMLSDVYNLKDKGTYTGIDDLYESKISLVQKELMASHPIYDEIKMAEGELIQIGTERGIDKVFETINIGKYNIEPADIKDIDILKYTPVFQNRQTFQIISPPDLMDSEAIVRYLDNLGIGWEEIIPGLRNIGEGKGLPDLDYHMRIKFFDRVSEKDAYLNINTQDDSFKIETKIEDTGKIGEVEGASTMFGDDAAKEFSNGAPNASCQL